MNYSAFKQFDPTKSVNRLRYAQSYVLLSLLSACGGGGGATNGSTSGGSSGHVIDGYISGARVFRDANGNNRYDLGENFAVTNSSGFFRGLAGPETIQIAVDDNGGSATDTVTGFPLSFTLAAPGDYSVVTPITTLVVGLKDKGLTTEEAEAAVVQTLGISSAVDLKTFDPFANTSLASGSVGDEYKEQALKIANVLMVSDGSYSTNSIAAYSKALSNFADLIEVNFRENKQISLGDPSVLKQILPDVSAETVSQLAEAHKSNDYAKTLDAQLKILSDNATGTIANADGGGEVFIAIEASQLVDASNGYSLTLTNPETGIEITSGSILSFGTNVVVFKFAAADVAQLGTGDLSVDLKNTTSGQSIETVNVLSNSVTPGDSPDTNVTVVVSGGGGGGGGGGGSGASPSNEASDSGVVADGYIQNARVFRDTAQGGVYNGTFDEGEAVAYTDANGKFTGLGGLATDPIYVDNNRGEAVDVSTGDAFNSILSAPAGSKVINPITTIINELIVSDDAADVSEANTMVAVAFGMEAVTDAGIDFTKFDPISKKTISETGTETPIADNNLADLTQGVATFVASLVVSGASEKAREDNGNTNTLTQTTKTLISNLKNIVKQKSDAGAQFDFSSADDVKLALGSDFGAASPALSLLVDNFSDLNPKAYRPAKDGVGGFTSSSAGIVSQDALLSKQILAQTEFGDGVLTSLEAEDGATLVVGPAYDPDTRARYSDPADFFSGKATVRIENTSNLKVFYKPVTFTKSEYASVTLSEDFLTNASTGLLGGGISVLVKKGTATDKSSWDALTDQIYDTDDSPLYFHHQSLPSISFASAAAGATPDSGITFKSSAEGKLTTLSGSVNNTNVDSLALSGSVEIDISATLPGSLKLFNLVSSVADNAPSLGDGDMAPRKVELAFVNSAGVTKFVAEAAVDPDTGGSQSARSGKNSFDWSISLSDALQSSTGGASDTFGALEDGTYKIKATFSDAYGATSTTEYSPFIIDRDAPEISTTDGVVITKTAINAVDESFEIKVNLDEPAIDRTDAQNDNIVFTETISDTTKTFTLTDAISGAAKTATDASGIAVASFNDDNTTLTIRYTPEGKGSLDVTFNAGAFEDATGNLSATSLALSTSTALTFDTAAPSVSSIALKDGINLDDVGGIDLIVTFDEPVTSFSKADVQISKISNAVPLEYVDGGDFTASADGKTWTAEVKPVADLQGSVSIAVAGASYADSVGNLGTGSSATFALDTVQPSIFTVLLDEDTEKATYGVSELEVGDTIDVIVTFDKQLGSVTGSPVIELQIGTETREATLVDAGNVSGKTSVKFSYQVTRSDLTTSDGIGIASEITGGGFKGVNGNTAVSNLNSISEPLDLSAKQVDGRSAGSVVDGYIEGAIIYADNNRDVERGLSEGDPIAQADATGGFSILNATGPLVLEGGFDISTNKDFNVRYSAPSTYKVINPISSLVVEEASDFSLASISSAEQAVYAAIDRPLDTHAFTVTPSSATGTGTFTLSAGGEWKDADVGKYIIGGGGVASLNDTDGNYTVVDAFSGASIIEQGSWYLVDTLHEFAIRPSDHDADGTFALPDGQAWAASDVGKYVEGNGGLARLLDTSGSYRIISHFNNTDEIAQFDWKIVDKISTQLSTYNAYEAIAEAADGAGDAGSIKDTVDIALAYQQVAASVALIVDFVSTSTFGTPGQNDGVSIPAISEKVFTAISQNLDSLVGAINSDGALPDPVSYFSGDAVNAGANDTLKAAIVAQLRGIFEPTGAVPLESWANVVQDFPDVYDLMATSIIAIKLTASKDLDAYTTPISADSTSEADKLAISEDGINALTEIVQVQSVVQNDILSQITKYYTKPDFAITPVGGKLTRADGETWSADDVGKTVVGNGGQAKLTALDGTYEEVNPFAEAVVIPSSSWIIFADKPTEVTVNKLLGSGAGSDGTKYDDVSVGTVVPIRYELSPPGEGVQFEGDVNGNATEVNFVISRAGSIKTTSSLEYSINGVSSADVADGILQGTVFFDVNEKEKIVAVRLNNDSVREPTETLTLSISDPTNTSQIVNGTASVIIRDDDPSTPEVELARTSYSLSEGAALYLDEVEVDYFDTSAATYFKLDWTDGGGTFGTKPGGVEYTAGTWVDYFTLQTSLLRNLEFTAGSDLEGFASVTLTAAEYDTANSAPKVGGRSASTDFEFLFDIHKVPSLDGTSVGSGQANDYQQLSGYAGVPLSVPGIQISDGDSNYLSVSVTSNLSGTLATTSAANFTSSRSSAREVTFAGEVSAVQSALDGLTFTSDSKSDPSVSGESGAIFTFRVDDADPLHDRDGAGDIQSTASNSVKFVAPAITILSSPPTITQGFQPKLTVQQDAPADPSKIIWNGFSGITVSDPDTSVLKVVISGDKDKVDLRLFDRADALDPIKLTSSLVGSNNTLTLEGQAAVINQQLDLLQIRLSANEEDLISINVYDGETSIEGAAQNIVELTPTYSPSENEVPDPGGDQAARSFAEDSGLGRLTLGDIVLNDNDAKNSLGQSISPDTVRIISVTGGTVTLNGASVFDAETGEPLDISVSNFKSGLDFTPSADFNGTASINYVVVDPQQSTVTSSISRISIEVTAVNDKPDVLLSAQPVTFTQNGAATKVFANPSVVDRDSTQYSEVKVSASGATWDGDADTLLTPSALQGVTKSTSEDGSEVTYSGDMTASDVVAILSDVRFSTSATDLTGASRSANQQREISVIVTDKHGTAPAASTSVSKQVILRDVNDAPEVTFKSADGAVYTAASREVAYQEADKLSEPTKIPLTTFIDTLKDIEGDSITSVKIKFLSGYRAGEDFFSGPASNAGGFAYEFDAATGAFLINSSGASAAEVLSALSGVSYSNSSDNPKSNNLKKIAIELTDEFGAMRASDPVSIRVTNTNDVPIFVDRQGNELSPAAGETNINVFGGQFVEGSGAVRVLSDVDLVDLDNILMLQADLVASDGALGLTKAGTQLRDAYKLKVEISGSSATIAPKAGAEMTIQQLESVLREVTIDALSVPDNAETTDNYAQISLTVRDASGATSPESDASATLVSKIKLLKAAPVQVKQISTSGTEFETIADQSGGITKVLTFNDTFTASSLFVNLEQSSIKTEDGRFTYDTEKNDYALREARHVDVSKMTAEDAAVASTSIIGQADADVILGSAYRDVIDGNGGADRILAGAGDDTISFRSTSGLYLDGGDGMDTLLLPSDFSGEVTLSQTSDTDLAGVTVKNFENLDARSAQSTVTLKGGNEANVLRGGSSTDVIHLGAGGDVASGGGGADTFLVNVENLSASGTKIEDLTQSDKIQFVDSSGAKVDFTWRHKPSYSEAQAVSGNEAWIEAETGAATSGLTVYKLKFTFNGTEKEIDIGTNIFGSIAKWKTADEDFFTLQPASNSKPAFSNSGPQSSLANPIQLAEDGDNFSLSLSSLQGGAPSVTDADNASDTLSANDPLYLSVTSENLVVTLGAGTSSFSTGLFPQFADASVNALTLDQALSGLKVAGTGSGRSTGNVTLSITDGYSNPITKTLYFEVPNSSPELQLDAITAFSENSIGTSFTLDQTGIIPEIASNFVDDDAQDIAQNAVTLRINVDGADVSLAQNPYQDYVKLIDSDILISNDGSLPLSGDWANVLHTVAKSVTLTRDIVGKASVSMTVTDAAGAQAQSAVKQFAFTPLPLPAPTLVVDGTTSNGLNGQQFDDGSVKATVAGAGASVGDTLRLNSYFNDGGASVADTANILSLQTNSENKITLSDAASFSEADVGKYLLAGDGIALLTDALGGYTIVREFADASEFAVGEWKLASLKSVDVTLGASATLAGRVQATVEVPLSDLLPAGADRNGNFHVDATLIPALDTSATSSSVSGLDFVVDSTAPQLPQVTSLQGAASLLTNGTDIQTITVEADPADGGSLLISVANIRPAASGAWYGLDADATYKTNPDGLFSGEIQPTSQVYEDGKYTLTFAQPLAGGVYAIAARDEVGNTAALNAAGFDISNPTLPNGFFVIDQTLDQNDLTFFVSNAAPISGDFVQFRLNRDEAQSLQLKVGSLDPGKLEPGSLPSDVVKLKVELWSDEQGLDASTEADISAEFVKDYTDTGTWSQDPSGASAYAVVDNSTPLIPTVDLNLTSLGSDVKFIGIKITATDVAGNNISVQTLENQIELDLTADAGSEADYQGIVTSRVSAEIINGVSKAEAASLEFTLSGVDDDVSDRSTFAMSEQEFLSKLIARDPAHTGTATSSVKLDPDPIEIDGVKVASYDGGKFYLDLASAATVSQVKKSSDVGGIASVKLDLTSILPADGSANQKFRIIHQLKDEAGNTNFREDLAPLSTPEVAETSQYLEVDVTAPAILEGLEIAEASDSGLQGDLVTSDQRPTLVFVTDEEIRANLSDTLSDGQSGPRLVHLSTLTALAPTKKYNLSVIDFEKISDGGVDKFKYTVELDAGVTLDHGVWGIEATDLAGNVVVADAAGITSGAEPYFAHADIVAQSDGVLLVDRLGPPDPVISIAGVEAGGGYLNASEVNASNGITIAPGIDLSSFAALAEDRVAEIISVEILGSDVPVVSASGALSFDSTLLADGDYTLRVTSGDVAGNLTVTDFDFTKDIAPPAATKISIDGGADDALNSTEFTDGIAINLEIADPADRVISVKLSGGVIDANAPLEITPNASGQFQLNALSDIIVEEGSSPDGQYSFTVVTADPAGNTTSDTYDFLVDTRPPPEPTLVIEGINGGLNYWEILDGFKIKTAGSEPGDFIDQNFVKLNGTNLQASGAADVYEGARSLILDGDNVLAINVIDQHGNEFTYDYTFDAELTPNAAEHIEIIPTVVSVGGKNVINFDLYLTEVALTQHVSGTADGAAVDVVLSLPPEFSKVQPTAITVSGEFEDVIVNAQIPGNGFLVTAISTDALGNLDNPFISFQAELSVDLSDFSPARGAEIGFSIFEINDVDLIADAGINLSQVVDLSDLIVPETI